jgi:hypothetical protein
MNRFQPYPCQPFRASHQIPSNFHPRLPYANIPFPVSQYRVGPQYSQQFDKVRNHCQPHVYPNAAFPNILPPPNVANDLILISPNGPNPAGVEKAMTSVIDPNSADGFVTQVEKAESDQDAAALHEPAEFTGEDGPLVKRYTEGILSWTKQLQRITGGNLIFVGSGNPPAIPDTYMSRDDYADRFNQLTETVQKAENDYEALVKVAPNDCVQYGEYVFGCDASLPDDVRKAAEKVKRARQVLRYFLDNRVSMDLNALRSNILNLHENITQAKHQLRALQFNGVDIGTQIFPNSGVVATGSDAPKYTPMSG